MFELLIAKDDGDNYEIVGVQPMDRPVVNSEHSLLRASSRVVDSVKTALANGKRVYVSRRQGGPEVVLSDLVIRDSETPLEVAKRLAYNDITNLVNQNAFGVSLLDAMDYLDCMMRLMSAGIFITDDNREDKYFEIIEAAQSVEEPKPLTQESSFDDEQNYVEQKRKYDQAQANLATLEKYLNAYDKLAKVKFVADLLNGAKDKVSAAKDVPEVTEAVREYCGQLDKYMFCDPKEAT